MFLCKKEVEGKNKEMEKYFKIITAVFLMISAVSCSKNDDVINEPESTFDINNPVGYLIYTKGGSTSPESYSHNFTVLFDFLPEGKMLGYSAIPMKDASEYTFTNANTIDYVYKNWAEFTFTFENSKLINVQATSNASNSSYIFSNYSLIKKPATNQLAGKTFRGKYLKKDGTVLQDGFYTFLPDGKKVDVGVQFPTKTRTETYMNVGNIGALVNKVSGTTNDHEIMILVDGKLQVNYRDNVSDPTKVYHGIFEEVK